MPTCTQCSAPYIAAATSDEFCSNGCRFDATSLPKQATKRSRSLAREIEPWIRHAKQFGGVDAVWIAALDSPALSAPALGYLCAALRKGVASIKENEGYWTGEGRNRRLVQRPIKIALADAHADYLIRRLLSVSIAPKQIRIYTGRTLKYIAKMAETMDSLGELQAVCTTQANAGLTAANLEPGQRFARLVVTSIEQDGPPSKRIVHLLCDCEAQTTARANNLVTGRKKSCGCLRMERLHAARATTKQRREAEQVAA